MHNLKAQGETTIITPEQESKIVPLLRQVIKILEIDHGRIEVVIRNKDINRIIPTDMIEVSVSEDKMVFVNGKNRN